MKITTIATLQKDLRVIGNDDGSRDLWNRSQYGAKLSGGQILFSSLEVLFLVESNRLQVFNIKQTPLCFDELYNKFSRLEKNLFVRYAVFKDFRSRGYVIKTALKFGADFRVYAKGVAVGEDHAKWIVFAVAESTHMTWHDFSAKNRVAHSTKKNLLVAVVDDEGVVSHYEIRWLRP